jgi:hypothetical protein
LSLLSLNTNLDTELILAQATRATRLFTASIQYAQSGDNDWLHGGNRVQIHAFVAQPFVKTSLFMDVPSYGEHVCGISENLQLFRSQNPTIAVSAALLLL